MADATRNPQPLDTRFTVPIRKGGAYATYLELPGTDDLLVHLQQRLT